MRVACGGKLFNAHIGCFHSGYMKTLQAVHLGSKVEEITSLSTVGCRVTVQLWPNAYVNDLTVVTAAMQFWWDLLLTNSTYIERNTETVRAQL
jgi:hypothetical protein